MSLPDDRKPGESTDESAAPPRPVPPVLPVLRTSSDPARSKDILTAYLSEIRRYPLLSPEEERDLSTRYQQSGDPESARRLVTSNLRLVVKIAFQYHRQWANVLDLIQEGNVGLVEALSRYDPYREIRFSSYAQYWIRAMILRFLLDNFRLVRLGSTRAGRKLFFQLQKERDRLLAEGEVPSHRLLAERLGVSEQDVNDVDQHMRAPALSLHAPMGDEDDGRTLADVVPDTLPRNPESEAARNELGGLVKDKLETFSRTLVDARERQIWERRLVASEPESLSALGEEFGVSKERIRQVEARIKKRLRVWLEAEMGTSIDFEFGTPDED